MPKKTKPRVPQDTEALHKLEATVCACKQRAFCKDWIWRNVRYYAAQSVQLLPSFLSIPPDPLIRSQGRRRLGRKQTHLGHFTKSPTLFPKVNNYSTSAVLGFLDGLLNAEDQIRPARADVGAEDVAAVTLQQVKLVLAYTIQDPGNPLVRR